MLVLCCCANVWEPHICEEAENDIKAQGPSGAWGTGRITLGAVESLSHTQLTAVERDDFSLSACLFQMAIFNLISDLFLTLQRGGPYWIPSSYVKYSCSPCVMNFAYSHVMLCIFDLFLIFFSSVSAIALCPLIYILYKDAWKNY